ncbi:hypothetical protein Tco_1263435 [Tanacetum coccineum]
MSITKEQQQALDDALVPREQRLTIGSCNYRLSTTFKPKEPTFQVALDVLSLTPFYPAFLITASVPAVYMQEFWATVTYQKHHIRFKMNKKSYSFDMETFRSMLMICPKPPGLKFEDPPFEEEILTFIRELGYSGNIKLLSDVKVDTLPQPWRTFGTIINKCLSGKVTRIDTLRLSRAQILWGLYHQKKIDYVYILREGPSFSDEEQGVKKENKYMFYPRIHKHEVVQRYGAILPDYLTNPAMKESEAYKTYHDLATGKVQPKPKYVRRSSRSKTEQEPKPSPGKKVKATAKVAKSGEKKQPALGLETLSKVALTEAEQLKLATKQSLIQTHISHASGSCAHKGTGVSPRVPYSFDPRVYTPSRVESTDDEDNDDEPRGANVEGKEMDKDTANIEGEGNELYRDVNINLEGRDAEITDAHQTIAQTTQVIEDTHVIITPVNPEGHQHSSSVSSGFVSNMLNPNPDSGIDSIFNVNTEATSLVDVPITTLAEPPILYAITLPPPPTPFISNLQQTPVPSPAIFLSSSLQDLPNFGSLFGFDHRLKTLETKFSEYKQMNQFVETVSSIPGIIDAYLANKMNEAVKIATSHAVAANLSKLELKKILIDKMEKNKLIHRLNEQTNIYKALVEAYESDKLILETYGETLIFKRRREDEDKDEEPSTGSNQGSKRRRAGNEPELTSPLKERPPSHLAKDVEEPIHQEFETGVTKDQPKTSYFPDWFQKPDKLPSPDRDWNKTLPVAHGSTQPWLSILARNDDPRESFDELMDTPLDFSVFVMNRLNVDSLTHELLAGPTFELMKGTCKSLVELEYFLEEVYKATTEQLDWINPEGQQYPYDL